jgi:hypothetical protein
MVLGYLQRGSKAMPLDLVLASSEPVSIDIHGRGCNDELAETGDETRRHPVTDYCEILRL